eukprot:m.888098 g.888098  ORF g.888098 m.888098 type:complete len:199 (-) comp23636_c0_seq63:1896-2492(-)
MHPRNTTQHKTQEDRSMRHGFTRCGYPLLPLTSHIRAAVCRPPMRWLQLYFPISFSLFKGKSVQVVHENGDWRTYGLGMVCISTTDFLASKGFSKTITGWGREDVDFYEHMLKNTSLTVLRSVDEGLVHIWHPKECNQAQLSADQFSDCVQSRADWEGDKLYLSRKLASYENVYGDIDFESARNSTTIRAAVTKAKHQ